MLLKSNFGRCETWPRRSLRIGTNKGQCRKKCALFSTPVPNNQHLCSLLEKNDLINIIKGPTCFKWSKGRCIDLILKNKRRSLMKTQSFETGFSDHHHLIYTILKTTYRKVPPKNWFIDTTKNGQKSALC